MPFWRIVPPPPRPWAQSVAPAALVGRRIAANPPRPAGAADCAHTRAPSPQGVGSQQKGLQTTNALPIIAPYKPSSCSGVPRQEQWRTVPPLPLPARPPPLKGWISIELQTTNALPFIAPCNPPSAPPILGCRPHPSRAPSPKGGGLPKDWVHTTNALLLIAPPPPPPCSG